jgi:type IV secretory pathway VirD2 relaxase
VVKARIVRHKFGSGASGAHLRYLQRDGTTRDGERGRLYDPERDLEDGRAFVERGEGDRHSFRLIVAPEDGDRLADLRAFTRDVMAQMEADLGTKLDWVAVDHYNTGHPHSHVVIRGKDDLGKDLIIAQDYITDGVRLRAQERATLELGPETDLELREKLRAEITAERFTRIDRAMIEDAPDRLLDLRPDAGQVRADFDRTLRLGRLQTLQRFGLAREVQTGIWTISEKLEPTMRGLGDRGDIIKTMHRALTDRGVERAAGDYAIHRDRLEHGPVIGRVIDKGLPGDQLGDRLHLVVDGIDGRVHYLEIADVTPVDEAPVGSIVEVGRAAAGRRPADRNILAMTDTVDRMYRPSEHLAAVRDTHIVREGHEEGFVEAHIRRLEALRRAGIVERVDADHWRIPEHYAEQAQEYDARRSRQIAPRVLSIIDLDAQVTANAATWLDRGLLAGRSVPVLDDGFGAEVRDAQARRRQWLIHEGLARQEGGKTFYRRDMVSALTQRELQQAGDRLGRERGLSFYSPVEGERISGTYRGALQLASGKFAIVEKSREFTLVPWRSVIEKELGRQVSGLMQDGGISWELGRARGLGISI